VSAEGWADHPGGIQLWAQDGHLGRVLPECPSGSKTRGPVARDDPPGDWLSGYQRCAILG
jgi:hypothetical protein